MISAELQSALRELKLPSAVRERVSKRIAGEAPPRLTLIERIATGVAAAAVAVMLLGGALVWVTPRGNYGEGIEVVSVSDGGNGLPAAALLYDLERESGRGTP